MEKNENMIEKYLKIGNEILYNPELDCTGKILLAEIQSLHKLEKGCFASNEHFALLLGLKTPAAASKRISKLTKMGYISTKNIYGKSNIVGRVITPTFKKAIEKSTESVPEHSKGSSRRNKVVPEEQEVSSDTTRDVVPTGLEGSSDSTRGVVPKGLGGSSDGNTIITYRETDLNNPLNNPLYYQYTGDTGIFDSVVDQFILNEPLLMNPEEEITTISPNSNNSNSSGNKTNLPEISIQEYREILNYFFEGYPSWEADLYKFGLEEFIQRTTNYHDNVEKYIGMISEFFEI